MRVKLSKGVVLVKVLSRITQDEPTEKRYLAMSRLCLRNKAYVSSFINACICHPLILGKMLDYIKSDVVKLYKAFRS